MFTMRDRETEKNNSHEEGPSSSTLPRSAVCVAMAWDPTSTATLALCQPPGLTEEEEETKRHTTTTSQMMNFKTSTTNLGVFLSHDGTGCPAEETECLIKCLDARDASLATATQQYYQHKKSRTTTALGLLTELSMEYRAVMCTCLQQLQKKAAQRMDAAATAGGNDAAPETNPVEEGNNMELLMVTYAISHLAEIFLLPSMAASVSNTMLMSSSSPHYASNVYGEFTKNDSTAARHRLDGPAGSLTADTVRYLRLHHSKGDAFYMDMPQVQAMLESDQPEYYRFSNSTLNDSIPGPFELPFWNLVLQFVIEGNLYKAWTVLSQHSACRRAEEEGLATPDGQAFEMLQRILLSAPLPGGRGDSYCDDTGLDDYMEEEMLLEREEDEKNRSPGRLRRHQHHELDAGDLDDIYFDYFDGVSSNAYLLWEALPRHADRIRMLRYRHNLRLCGGAIDLEDACDTSGSPTVPELYQPRVALSAFRVWQETIRKIVFPASSVRSNIIGLSSSQGVLAGLIRRFPPLQQIISILIGEATPSFVSSLTLSWDQRLLIELLYSRPDIAPEDIAVRAKVAMEAAGVDFQTNALNEIILRIMQGSAGQVIDTMFSVCGGSSGAALPATMSCLICNLLVDAGCMSPVIDSSTSKVNIQTELLLLASEAIISSFSVQGQCSVGVRTAIQLLLPHAPAKRATRMANDKDASPNEEVTYEPRIAAMIAEVLMHRLPSSDAEARDLMVLCEESIRLGSVVIADACESLAFSRAWHHGSNDNLMREAYWLLRGIEIQSCWLPPDRIRRYGYASRRNFDSLCERYANSLISILSIGASAKMSKSGLSKEQEKTMSSVFKAARNFLNGVVQDDVMAPVLKGHMEANLLKFAVDIAMADAVGDSGQVASAIIQCLEDRCLSDDYGGVVSTFADPTMYAKLLNIAFVILEKNDKDSRRGPMEFAKCDFTMHGMQILMARLTQVSSWNGDLPNLMAMREAFCKGLMRLILNKQPAEKTKASKSKHADISLEDEIEIMLSPRIASFR